MLSRSQEKLLRYLGGFPDALSQAWDVPREVSLPGLSDAMGVVRSGLNQPLKALLDAAYISVRVAHVIGGGARRRQVYHITESGRRWLHEHPEEATKASTATASKAPPTTALVGRQAELETLTNLLEKHGHALVGGLSGVGKTTLLRAWAARQETDVRWATVDQLSDAVALVDQWTNGAEAIPEDLEAMVEHLDVSGPTVLVVDDVHRVDPRHQSTVADLLDGLLGRGHRLLLGGRLPVPDRFDWPLLRLGTLPAEEAVTLLGEHLDEVTRLDVAKALDGHPMALNLYREGDPLPEAGADIQAFVEQTMLDGLSDDALESLDDMVLFPRPLPSDEIRGGDHIGELDERALLRWSTNNEAVEVQHLIRNVRRTMLDEGRLLALHRRAADHWEAHLATPAYAVLHLYHRLALEEEGLEEILATQFDRLMVDQGGALAVIFDRATQQRPEDEQLHYWAGRIALHRQERANVREHLASVRSEGLRRELAHGLAVLEGDTDEADRLLNLQLDQGGAEDGARWLLKAAVQRLEDRLFDEKNLPDLAAVQRMLQQIQLPERLELRSSMTVSMSLVQHTMALLDGDRERAEALVEGLESLSHPLDPIVLRARFKAMLAFNETPDMHQATYEKTLAAQPSAFHRGAVGLTYAEHLVKHQRPEARALFASLPSPDTWSETGTPQHRYAARWWYLKGHVDPSYAASALRESARWFRQAGCVEAAKAAARRLHRVL